LGLIAHKSVGTVTDLHENMLLKRAYLDSDTGKYGWGQTLDLGKLRGG
jgi:hypothetical protein